MLIGGSTGSGIVRTDVMAGEELVAIECQVVPTILVPLFISKTPSTVMQSIQGATQVISVEAKGLALEVSNGLLD